LLILRMKVGESAAPDGSRAWFENRTIELPLPASLFRR
jgi:hypothetical protein